MQQYNIICGGAKTPKKITDGNNLHLNVQGKDKNVELKIHDINKTTLSNISDELLDLLEIAAYVYSADQQIKRGNEELANYGSAWRRGLNFIIPVRKQSFWNGSDIITALEETLGFLSGETYKFSFVNAEKPFVDKQQYFEFCDNASQPDEVALFSGGIDSFAGAVEGIVGNDKKMALVGHYSSGKVKNIQTRLINELCSKGYRGKLQYISVEVRNSGIEAEEYTQRSRSFLFACLAVTIANLFGKDRFSFYENGVVSLNLPLTKDILESRATRTTHPRVINGFKSIFSLVLKKPITVDHPFQWNTKKEIVEKIKENGCENLIGITSSCTRPKGWTKQKKHCGKCSQCIDRRFAILAAGLESHDSAENYKVDLLMGDRSVDREIVMAASYVRFAQDFSQLSKERFISEHPQIASALNEFEELSTSEAEEKIFQLYRKHSSDVISVLKKGYEKYQDRIAEGTLPSRCLLAASFIRSKIEPAIPTGYDDELQKTLTHLATKRCQFFFDEKQSRIVFKGGYAVTGGNYKLIAALIENFRTGKKNGSDIAYITSSELAERLGIEEASLRKQIGRTRDELSEKLATDQGIVLGTDGFIENSERQGYRLNPELKEVNSISDLDD